MMKRWCAIFGSRMAQLPWMRLFLDTLLYNIILMYLSAFWLYETHKRSLELLQSYDYESFLGPKWPTSPEYIFFQKTINIILMYLLDPSIVQDFWKKNIRVDSKLWRCIIFVNTMAICPKDVFGEKPLI